ncbi:unnamed protein product [Camellia sinensis]
MSKTILFILLRSGAIDSKMGTREAYEEKLRSGNLYHDPTMNPGLGSPRCPRCLSLLNPNVDNGEWAITSVLHDATAVELALELAECLVQFMVSIQGSRISKNMLKDQNGFLFLLGLPPLLMFSAASVAFGGYALPKFAQLTVTSYYAASSASHYGISLLTGHIEDSYTYHVQQKRLR